MNFSVTLLYKNWSYISGDCNTCLCSRMVFGLGCEWPHLRSSGSSSMSSKLSGQMELNEDCEMRLKALNHLKFDSPHHIQYISLSTKE